MRKSRQEARGLDGVLGLGILLGVIVSPLMAETLVDYEDVMRQGAGITTYEGPGGGVYYNGSDGSGGFTSGGVFFPNTYNADWMSWSGWAYATVGDVTTAGFSNQYSAYPGAAASGEVHAVIFAPVILELPEGNRMPRSIKVANTTYGALSMRDGDMFAKKFGDDPATEDVVESDYPDFFKLTITGLTRLGSEIGSVEVYLADYRGNAEEDSILDMWQTVDLDPITGNNAWNPGYARPVAALSFTLESSDVGAFGMNTPAYIAVDDVSLGAETQGPGWENTGDWLGWVSVDGDWIYLLSLNTWAYLPLPKGHLQERSGAWLYFPR